MTRSRLLLLFCVLGLLTINLNSAASGPPKTFASADLVLAPIVGDDSFDIQIFDFHITNKGSDTAQNAVFTFPIPEGCVFDSVFGVGNPQLRFNTPSQFVKGDVICSLGDVPPNGSITVAVHILYRVPGGTRISTQASVSSDTFDSDASNNTSSIDFELIPVARIDSIRGLKDPFRIEITGVSLQVVRFSGSSIGIGCDCEPLPLEFIQFLDRTRIILQGGNKLKKLFPKGVPTHICHFDEFYSRLIKTVFTR